MLNRADENSPESWLSGNGVFDDWADRELEKSVPEAILRKILRKDKLANYCQNCHSVAVSESAPTQWISDDGGQATYPLQTSYQSQNNEKFKIQGRQPAHCGLEAKSKQSKIQNQMEEKSKQ